MKIKIPNRKPKPKPNGALADAVAECCRTRKALDAMYLPAAGKLTADAALRAAIRIADTTLERLRERREKIFDPENPMWFEVKATLRRMVVAFRSPNWAGPSRELRRYNFMLTGEALSEIVALGSSTFEIAALAMQLCAEQHPEAFGRCSDLASHEKRLLELALRRDDLYHQIETQFTGEDVLIDPQGRKAVSYKLSGGAVTLGPNGGERLVAWALQNPEKSD